MVGFLLFALMITGWMNTFQEPINEAAVAYYLSGSNDA
jgi:hypothetical protein